MDEVIMEYQAGMDDERSRYQDEHGVSVARAETLATLGHWRIPVPLYGELEVKIWEDARDGFTHRDIIESYADAACLAEAILGGKLYRHVEDDEAEA